MISVNKNAVFALGKMIFVLCDPEEWNGKKLGRLIIIILIDLFTCHVILKKCLFLAYYKFKQPKRLSRQ